jgi:HPt (histidine-containing phosphotransfer) domain-containing protein
MAIASKGLNTLNFARLLEDCDDETVFAHHCLRIFVRETKSDIDAIAESLRNNDWRNVSRLAHRIKGASAAIRASFLSQEAARLEVSGREGNGTDAAWCFSRLQAELKNFEEFVSTLPRLPEGDETF